jgi:membrane protease YdiL (CAAX protease family)
VLAIILSALFFSVMHTPQTIIFAFLIGLLLAVMTLNLQTLWAPIIVHATFNLAAILDWACLHTIWNPVESTPSLSVIGSFALLTSLICVTSLIWLARRGKAGTQIAPRP